MEWLGRYSMTDVMVLALMIFYVNSSGYTEASVQTGVYFFAASTIMTMLAISSRKPNLRKRVASSARPASATARSKCDGTVRTVSNLDRTKNMIRNRRSAGSYAGEGFDGPPSRAARLRNTRSA